MPRGVASKIGEERIAQNGYSYTKTETGWRLSHHVVAEENLGRPLRPTERVYFADNDRTNLDPDNIVTDRIRTGRRKRIDALKQVIRTKVGLLLDLDWEEGESLLSDLTEELARKKSLTESNHGNS
jgi:hypothetical protein